MQRQATLTVCHQHHGVTLAHDTTPLLLLLLLLLQLGCVGSRLLLILLLLLLGPGRHLLFPAG
jgi:hypothetical protein